MLNKIKHLVLGEEGQGMTEYGLIMGIIGIGVIVALVALREQIATLIEKVKGNLEQNTPVLTQ